MTPYFLFPLVLLYAARRSIHYFIMYRRAAPNGPPQGGTKGTGSEAACSKVRDDTL